ncbi:TMhelix containing protein [Vibrio phage 1.015.O._10N.222.51.E5]|nr:TMhelix containing protein [Vibrio phage 1.015.O._10N.222.51.E5]
MATVAAIAGVVGAVAGIAGAVQQRSAAKKVAREQKKQNALNNRMQLVSRRRDIRRAIALNRVQQAQVEQGGINAGVQGSSIVSGVTGALTTDLATSVGASNTQTGASQGIANSQARMSDAQVDAQGNVLTDISNFAGNFTDAGMNEVYKSELTGLFS